MHSCHQSDDLYQNRIIRRLNGLYSADVPLSNYSITRYCFGGTKSAVFWHAAHFVGTSMLSPSNDTAFSVHLRVCGGHSNYTNYYWARCIRSRQVPNIAIVVTVGWLLGCNARGL